MILEYSMIFTRQRQYVTNQNLIFLMTLEKVLLHIKILRLFSRLMISRGNNHFRQLQTFLELKGFWLEEVDKSLQ